MADSSVAELDFPDLTVPVRFTAPPRSLGTGGWRDALNMVPREGKMLGRPGVQNGWPVSRGQPPAPPTISGVDTADIARIILETGSVNTSTTSQVIFITTRRILIYNGSWRDATPTYTAGTVSATNGSTSITGSGTQWSTLRVSGYIDIDGSWYKFSNTGDTTATITPAFSGVTGAGKSYTIKRVFTTVDLGPGHLDSFVYATVYNGILYVAVHSADNAGYVVKVTNLLGVPSSSYIFGTVTHQSGQDASSALKGVSGVAALQDGRVVVTSRTSPSVFYSSHLDDTVWNTAPGGRTDLAEIATGITALGRMGSTLTFHHDNGVILGDPTGLSDPPIRFQRSGADIGAAAPLTLRSTADGEMFLGSDGGVWLFDGNRARAVERDDLRARLRSSGVVPEDPFDSLSHFRSFFACVIPSERTYILMHTDLTAYTTSLWIFKDGAWWPGSVTTAIGAMSDGIETRTSEVWALVGTASDSSDSVALRYFREGEPDALGTPIYMLETDDLDFGHSLLLKTPHRLVLWAVEALTDIVASVRTAQASGGTYSHSVTKSPASQVPTFYDFIPNSTSDIPAATAHRFKLSGSDLRKGVFALRIGAAIGGDVQMSGQ